MALSLAALLLAGAAPAGGDPALVEYDAWGAVVREGERRVTFHAPRDVPGRGAPRPGVARRPPAPPPAPLPAYRDEEWKYTILGSSIGAAGLIVMDIDADGTEELVLGSSSRGVFEDDDVWHVMRASGADTYTLVRSSGSYAPSGRFIHRIAAGDAEGDGVAEIFVGLDDGTIEVFEGREFRRKGSFVAGGTWGLSIVDVDDDGRREIVCSDGQDLFVHSATAPFALERQVDGVGGSGIAVGNVDRDPAPEIVVGGGAGGGYVIGGLTGVVEWAHAGGFGKLVELGDIDADGIDEIVGAEHWYQVMAFDADTRALKWDLDLGWDIDALRVGDADGDGVPEILVGQGQWGGVIAYDGAAKVKWSIRNPEHGTTNIAIGDADRDGKTEIIWGAGWSSSGSDHLFVAEFPGSTIEWSNDHLDGPFSALDVGDVDDDGRDEIVMATFASESQYGGGVVLVFDAETHALEWASQPRTADWAGVSGVAIGDVDGDGDTELVVTNSDGHDGFLEIYEGRSHVLERETAAYGGTSFTDIEIGDVDGDGAAEIVAGLREETSSADDLGFIVFDGATALEEWRSVALAGYYGTVQDLEITDLEGDGKMEILAAGGRIWGYPWIPATGGKAWVYSASRRIPLWTAEVGALSVEASDVDGDGILEVLVGEAGGYVGVYDGQSFALEGRYLLAARDVTGLVVADPDGDGEPEWLVGDGAELSVYDGRTQVLESRNGPLGWPAPVCDSIHVRDPDGDGDGEILHAAGAALYQLSARPRSNSIPVAAAGSRYEGAVETPIFLDASASVDMDGLITLYEWDLDGDGTFDWSGASPSLSHLFDRPGSREVTLRVTDDFGDVAEDHAVVKILKRSFFLTSPDGGESASSGEVMTIAWNNDAQLATASLYYSLTGKKPWKLIASGVDASLASFDWTIPILTEASQSCRVKLKGYRSSGKKAAVDVSDGAFSLSP